MKFLRNIFDKQAEFIKKNRRLRKFYPVIEATDEFFFGTDKTTTLKPHVADNIDLKRYMSFVIIGLLPATIAGVYFYGLRVLAVILVSYAVGGIVESVFSIVRRKPIYEGFLVTGLIFPLVLPPSIPLWMVGVGVAFGVFFGKEVFGGTGRNIFNPALVGRVFLVMAFPAEFTSEWRIPFVEGLGGFMQWTNTAIDAITSATPLSVYKISLTTEGFSNLSLLMGGWAGTIGGTFKIGIIVGGIFLIITKISDWRTPFTFLLSVLVLSGILNMFSPLFVPPVFAMLTGGLLFGAFFMATDPVSSAITSEGKWICGILMGILTVLIRALSGFSEGIMFSILLVNALHPLIDSLVMNFKFKEVSYDL